MFIRNTLGVAVLCLAASAGAINAQNVFFLPGQGSASQTVSVFTENPFTALNTFGSAQGTFQAFTLPDGSKTYLLGSTGANPVVIVDPTFSKVQTIGNIPNAASGGALSPDGRRLVVLAQKVQLIDTSTDTTLVSGGYDVGGTPVDVAIALDSSRAFVVATQVSGSTVFAIDLRTNQKLGQTITIPGIATGITVAPNGLVYVGAQNRLFEIDGSTMTITTGGEIQLNGIPGKAVATPDGHYLFLVNKSPITGALAFQFDLYTRRVVGKVPLSTTIPNLVLGNLYPVSKNRIIATSLDPNAQVNGIYEITVDPLNIDVSPLASTVPFLLNSITGVAISNEIPARYLFATVNVNGQPGLYRFDLANNSASGQNPIPNQTGVLSFTSAAATQGAATILLYNNNQVLAVSSKSLPLIVRVLDGSGRPVRNVPVKFEPSAGATVANPTVTTTGEGYAQTTVTSPATSGQFTVTVTVGTTATSTYTLSVSGTTGGGGGGDAGVFIVSGNGQLVKELFQANAPLVVLVKDVNGNPLAGAAVTWTITSGKGTLQKGETVVTDAKGLATNTFLGTAITGNSFLPTTINVSSAQGSVNFYITTFASDFQVVLIAPTLENNRTIAGRAGQTIPGAVQIQLNALGGAQSGQPIPNVSVRLVDPDALDDPNHPAPPPSSPVASCIGAGGVALSNAQGYGNCDIKPSGVLGTGYFQVYVGEVKRLQVVALVTSPGPAGLLQIIQGDKQTGNGGDKLPIALVVRISDGYGNFLPGTQVAWSVVQGAATLSQTVNSADGQANVSTLVTLGFTPGPVQIKVALVGNPAVSATFNLTANVAVGGLSLSSGDGQSTTVGQPYSSPLAVTVTDSNGNPLSGATVNFAVSSGNTTLSATSAVTNSQGSAFVTAIAGFSAGTTVVTASIAGSTSVVQFTLTARLAGPSVGAGSFVNAAGFQGGLTPCGLATVTGTGLASTIQGIVAAPSLGIWPTTLAGVSLNIGGIAAPLQSVSHVGSNEQVNFQTPCELSAGQTTVTITVNGGTTTITGVPVFANQPGVFTYTTFSGQVQAILQRAIDGSYITPSNPARRGETLYAFATGLAQTTPLTLTNAGGIPGQTVNSNLVVGVNNGGAHMNSALALPGAIGIVYISFDVPADSATGPSIPFAIGVFGADGASITLSNGTTFPVQ